MWVLCHKRAKDWKFYKNSYYLLAITYFTQIEIGLESVAILFFMQNQQ